MSAFEHAGRFLQIWSKQCRNIKNKTCILSYLEELHPSLLLSLDALLDLIVGLDTHTAESGHVFLSVLRFGLGVGQLDDSQTRVSQTARKSHQLWQRERHHEGLYMTCSEKELFLHRLTFLFVKFWECFLLSKVEQKKNILFFNSKWQVQDEGDGGFRRFSSNSSGSFAKLNCYVWVFCSPALQTPFQVLMVGLIACDLNKRGVGPVCCPVVVATGWTQRFSSGCNFIGAYRGELPFSMQPFSPVNSGGRLVSV